MSCDAGLRAPIFLYGYYIILPAQYEGNEKFRFQNEKEFLQGKRERKFDPCKSGFRGFCEALNECCPACLLPSCQSGQFGPRSAVRTKCLVLGLFITDSGPFQAGPHWLEIRLSGSLISDLQWRLTTPGGGGKGVGRALWLSRYWAPRIISGGFPSGWRSRAIRCLGFLGSPACRGANPIGWTWRTSFSQCRPSKIVSRIDREPGRWMAG